MFVGHYGVSFAARAVGKRIPLWVWFLAVQWMDIVWSVLVLCGIEKLRIAPGFTQANALDLYYMPYTHGLPGSIALALILGIAVALFIQFDRVKTMLLVAAASFSHWILDLVVHTPDLPLYGNNDKVGLGLWRHVAMSFPLELAILGGGASVYAGAISFRSPGRRLLFWGFILFLAVVQGLANFGPPPQSPAAMAWSALFLYSLLVLLAARIERLVAVNAL